MLIWVNGPFGAGRTAVAHTLVGRLDVADGPAVVCDPEHIGFGLHRTLPPSLRGDFQDLPAWRRSVVDVLSLADRGHDGPIVVPMTLVDPDYFEEVVGGLRRAGHDVAHVALMARRDTIVGRLARRGRPGLRHETFALAQVDRCLDALADPRFAEHEPTDDVSVGRVTERVAELAGLRLAPDDDGPVRTWLRLTATSLRHLRRD